MTTTSLQVFNYNNNEVRTIDQDGEPWFVAKDVCDVLTLTNPTETVKSLDSDEKSTLRISEGGPEINIISESGLYTLVIRSNKPEAKTFKRWITHEVLPTIRKTGYYSMGGSMTQSEFEKAIDTLDNRIHELEKLVSIVSISTGSITLQQAAHKLHVEKIWHGNEWELIDMLVLMGIIQRHKTKRRKIVVYKKFLDAGYFEWPCFVSGGAKPLIKSDVVLTGKGWIWLCKMLLDLKIKRDQPLIENAQQKFFSGTKALPNKPR